MKIETISINQPFGILYSGKLLARDINSSSVILRRSQDDMNGVQRDEEEKRISSIRNYCNDPEAIFPTPILLSCNSDYVLSRQENNGGIIFEFEDRFFTGETIDKPFRLIDGQHRILGIVSSSNAEKFELPIVIILDADVYQEAYIFSTINGNQKPVQPSLIYELFDYSPETKPSVERTCHIITKSLNQDINSPFCGRIKMLGKNIDQSPTASLSQGTVASKISELISSDPQADNINLKNRVALDSYNESRLSKYIFRNYFINDQIDIMTKILLNYFSAIANIYTDEWNTPKEFLLSKSIGYSAMIRFLVKLFPDLSQNKNLSEPLFQDIFRIIRSKKEIDLKASGRGSSESLAAIIAKDFLHVYESVRQNINWDLGRTVSK